MAVSDFLERGARLNPDAVCIVQGERRHRYREVRALAWRVAHALLRDADTMGIARHAAILCGNDATGFACSFGIMRAGWAYVPMDFRNSADDNAKILDFGDVDLLFFQAEYAEQVRRLRERLPRLRACVCLDADLTDFASLAQWLADAPESEPPVEVDAAATAWLQTGSGTSGDFRMAMQPHRAYNAFVAYSLLWLPDPAPVMLVAAPITHAAGGLAYPVLAQGGRLVLLDRPDPGAMLEAIERHRVTQLFLPPTVIYRLMAHPNVRQRDLSSLRYLAFSAAPMAVAKLREAVALFGPIVAQGYGQTEALGITCMRPDELLASDGAIAPDARLAACGRPALPFCRVIVMADDGTLLPAGEAGEICVRGDQVMTGYYKNEAATRATLVDGWLHTGDIGRFDDAGYLHIVDRKKDMIVSGGFNVHSAEIEQALAEHPAVHEAAVIGVPDDDWGEAVRAVVVLRAGHEASAVELIAHCKRRLGSVKAPKAVDFVADLPRSARGKVLKRVLRELHWAGRERQV